MQRLGDIPDNRKPRFGEAAAKSTSKKGKFVTQTISDRFIFSKVFHDITALITWASFFAKIWCSAEKKQNK